ncbi:jupiter microtubule associated homolog 1 isoform X1 [Capricornis sumatraensis]|uniref:jupiter microtubule associated homolog 1 isoform X1 n=1 Tax=Capricornis sumatraensis TaxID=34865 RepID=UPI00360534D8
MTTTTTFKGVDPNSRNSSRVLRPPGGGSNFSLGFDEPTEQPVRRNKMASSIFGTPEENPPSWAKSAGAKSSGGREDSESSGPQRRNSSEANSGDFLDLKGEGDVHGEKRGHRLAGHPGAERGEACARRPCAQPSGAGTCAIPEKPPWRQVQPRPGLAPSAPDSRRFVSLFFRACEPHNLSLTGHLLDLFH